MKYAGAQAAPIRRASVAISPLLLATLTFIAGAWLLVCGVTPLSGVATDLLELLASRRQFERRSALFSHALGGAWILSIAWVVAACVLILFLAYAQVDYDR